MQRRSTNRSTTWTRWARRRGRGSRLDRKRRVKGVHHGRSSRERGTSLILRKLPTSSMQLTFGMIKLQVRPLHQGSETGLAFGLELGNHRSVSASFVGA